MNLTERNILKELSIGPRTTTEMSASNRFGQYNNVRRCCLNLEKQGLIRRTDEKRNYRWIVNDSAKDVVVEEHKMDSITNGVKNLSVVRNYNHDERIPTNIKEFVDPAELTKRLRAIMFKTNGILMEGDSGIGKTHITLRIAMDDNLPFYLIQGTPDTRVEDLIGFPMQVGDHTMWVDGILPKVLLCSQQRRCVLFIDEINRLESNVQSVFFPLLDDRCSVVIHERGGEIIRGKKENLAVVATANIGTGFYGINPLDRAFEDRFDVFKIDYLDSASEVSLLHKQTGIYKELCDKMVKCANDIREQSRDTDAPVEKPLSTRCLLRWGMLAQEFFKNKVGKDPLMDAGEIAVINHYSGQDQDTVRTVIEHLKGTSMNEKKQKKKKEKPRTDKDREELEAILEKLNKHVKQP